MNIWTYIYRIYIYQLLRQLTEEYNLFSSIYKLCLSVITDKRFYVWFTDGESTCCYSSRER
jgi:hypothetical protein